MSERSDRKRDCRRGRERLVSEALADGRDPAEALMESRTLCRPTYGERVQGADKGAVAVHRMATALESTTVRRGLAWRGVQRPRESAKRTRDSVPMRGWAPFSFSVSM